MNLNLTLNQIAEITNGQLNNLEFANIIINDISLDTRTIKKGDMFLPLKGLNFDGHDYIEDAVKKGASAIICKNDLIYQIKNIPFVSVQDTTLALGLLGKHRRELFSNLTVIGVTGSNGKTTTKEMIAHILSQSNRNVVKSIKSFNNQIGVPLTLLEINENTNYAVIEMGTNSPGEIAYLAGICHPDIGVITNIGESHIEGLHNIEGVAKEKIQLIENMNKDGIAVINVDNEYLKNLTIKMKNLNVITVGMFNDAEIRAVMAKSKKDDELKYLINNQYELTLNLLGPWNGYNALVSIGACFALDFTLDECAKALKSFVAPPMRMEKVEINGITFINDAYNANPRSTELAIDEFNTLNVKGEKIFVFGEMKELGRDSDRYHLNIYKKLNESDADIIIVVGDDAKIIAEKDAELQKVKYFETSELAAAYLNDVANSGDLVFLKGSRAIKLEKILDVIRETTSKGERLFCI